MRPASLAGHVLELLMLADRRSTPVDRIVSEFFRDRRYLGSRDRRVISDTLFGFIRYRRTLETLLEGFLAAHSSYAPVDEAPRRYVPLLVIYAILFPGLFPAPPRAGEDDSPEPPGGETPAVTDVSSLWTPYFPDLDPAPLASWTREHVSLDWLDESPSVTLGIRYSFQDWMVDDWSKQWPIEESGEVEALLAALNRPGEVSLRVNTLKSDREEVLRRLAAEGIGARGTEYPPQGVTISKRFNQNASAAFKEGLFEVQDAGSQVVSLACAPAPGQLVIDGCAGAGGKSLHLADLMGNRGNVIALDTDPARLRELHKRAERAGVTIIEPSPRREFREKEYEGKADLVLVDAPCSGSGTIRRNPSLKWSVREEDVARFAARQLDLLGGYAPLVKKGGKLVYSTCSLFRAENEEVVGRFLAAWSGFRSVSAAPGGFPWPDAAGGGDSILLLPHRHGTDGFFVAAFERTG